MLHVQNFTHASFSGVNSMLAGHSDQKVSLQNQVLADMEHRHRLELANAEAEWLSERQRCVFFHLSATIINLWLLVEVNLFLTEIRSTNLIFFN